MASKFTAHNIKLDDGSLTIPEMPYQMEDLPLLKFTKRLLSWRFLQAWPGSGLSTSDVLRADTRFRSCAERSSNPRHCNRESNIENCRLIKQATDLPNLEFVCDDVKNLEKYGKFDAIFCCGILYHLDEPRKFLEQMSRACERVLVIDTHVAAEQPNRTFTVSEVTQHEGLAGRWFAEIPSDQGRQQDKWSSWDNAKSFWPMKRDLVEAVRQLGFSIVFEYPIYEPHREATDRVTIVGVKD